MSRTLSGSLTTAVSANARIPSVAVSCEDHIQHYATYQSSNSTGRYFGACVANDGSIIRVQVTAGGTGFNQNFQYQRITAPGTAGQWTTWTTFAGGAGNMYDNSGCAVSNNSGTLRAFAQQGTGILPIVVWTSTDNGVTWSGAPTTVANPPGAALTKGFSSAGNNDIFFIYDVLGGDDLGCCFIAAGVWSAIHTWTFAPMGYGEGLAVTYHVADTLYYIFTSDIYTLYAYTYNSGSNTWLALPPIAPAATTGIARFGPMISYDSSAGVYNLICCDASSGIFATPYGTPRLRQSRDLLHWSSGVLFYNISTLWGAIILHSSAINANLLISTSTIQKSDDYNAGTSSMHLDASQYVLSYLRREHVGHASEIEIVLDNKGGVLNSSIGTNTTYAPINLNTSIILNEGYKTGTPPTTIERVKVATYHINQIHFLRTPHENAVKIVAYDLSRNLDLVNRFQNTYTNQSISYLITEVCARAGLFSVSLPATTQMSNTVPIFILQSGPTYRKALDELCDTYQLDYFLDESEQMIFKEKGGETAVWTYQPEVESFSFGNDDLRANHTVVTGRVPAGASAGTVVTAEAWDDTNMHLVGLERILHKVDYKLTTYAECLLKAQFLLTQEERGQIQHQISVPANPALQLLDAIQITDYNAPQGSSQSSLARIVQQHLSYVAESAHYDMVINVEGL